MGDFCYGNFMKINELNRYSRHLILQEVNGQEGLLRLRNTKIAVIGAGGLGNSACSYLAAAGFGTIGVIDDDVIELNNLNRQILYSEDDVGLFKAEVLCRRLSKFNPNLLIYPVTMRLSYENSVPFLTDFDLVVDCTDNPYSRYCISDTCSRLHIPLVFGSAITWNGQVSVFCYKNGPCLRCIFHALPPAETVGSCDSQGIMGPIVGIIGSTQALEAVKITLGLDGVLSARMFLFDGLRFRTRVIKLRQRSASCLACNSSCDISSLAFPLHSCEEQYCSIPNGNQLNIQDYYEMVKGKVPHALIDVRSSSHYTCAKLDHSIHIPIDSLLKMTAHDILVELETKYRREWLRTLCVICRKGQSSRNAANYLITLLSDPTFGQTVEQVYNVNGGFLSWSTEIDTNFPYF